MEGNANRKTPSFRVKVLHVFIQHRCPADFTGNFSCTLRPCPLHPVAVSMSFYCVVSFFCLTPFFPCLMAASASLPWAVCIVALEALSGNCFPPERAIYLKRCQPAYASQPWQVLFKDQFGLVPSGTFLFYCEAALANGTQASLQKVCSQLWAEAGGEQ